MLSHMFIHHMYDMGGKFLHEAYTWACVQVCMYVMNVCMYVCMWHTHIHIYPYNDPRRYILETWLWMSAQSWLQTRYAWIDTCPRISGRTRRACILPHQSYFKVATCYINHKPHIKLYSPHKPHVKVYSPHQPSIEVMHIIDSMLRFSRM